MTTYDWNAANKDFILAAQAAVSALFRSQPYKGKLSDAKMTIMNVTTSNSRIVKALGFLSPLLLENNGTFSPTASQ